MRSSVARAHDVLDQPGLGAKGPLEPSRAQFPVLPGLGAYGHTSRVQFPVTRGLGHRGWGSGHIGPPCAANQAFDRKANKHRDPGSGVGRPARRELSSGTQGPCASYCTERLRGSFCTASHGAAVTADKRREPGIYSEDFHVSQCNGLPAEPVCATSEVAVWEPVARCKLVV